MVFLQIDKGPGRKKGVLGEPLYSNIYIFRERERERDAVPLPSAGK